MLGFKWYKSNDGSFLLHFQVIFCEQDRQTIVVQQKLVLILQLFTDTGGGNERNDAPETFENR